MYTLHVANTATAQICIPPLTVTHLLHLLIVVGQLAVILVVTKK